MDGKGGEGEGDYAGTALFISQDSLLPVRRRCTRDPCPFTEILPPLPVRFILAMRSDGAPPTPLPVRFILAMRSDGAGVRQAEPAIPHAARKHAVTARHVEQLADTLREVWGVQK